MSQIAHITATIGEKGGGAKSTTIQNLAVQLALLKKKVVVVDLDPQGTTRKWGARRRADRHPPALDVHEVTARNLQRFLEINAPHVDHILLDTGGADSDGMRFALVFADVVLCPCEPSQADVETLEHVNTLVGRAKVENPKLDAFVFTTKAFPDIFRHNNVDMVEACANYEHLTLLNTVIGYRKAFKNALRDGLAVVEYPRTDFTAKAIEEAQSLVKEVFL